MDPMDIDSIVYVPDTPDRLATRQTKFSSIDVPDSPDKPAAGDNFNGNTGRGSNDKDRNVIRANENGIRKPLMRPPRRHHGDSSAGAALGNSFSKSSIVSKRHEPSHNQCAKSEKIQNSISYDPREGSIEDLTGQHCHGNKGKKAISLGGIQIIENGRRLLSDKGEKAVSAGGSKTGEKGKNFVSAAQLHSHQNVADSRLVSRINNGKGISNSVSALDRGKGIDSNTLTPPKVGQLDSTSFSSPRNTGQKRLVRNGCISPSNVANAQKDSGKANNGSIDVGPSHVSSSRTAARVHTNVPLADTQASNVSKGKGIIPLLNEEPGGQNANDSGSVSINEILEEDEDSNRGSILGGWRNTHNRSRNTCPSSSEEHQFPPVGHSSVLSSSESPLPLIERLNVLRARSNPHNGDHLGTTGMIRKRQKQGSSSSIQDVRSQNTSADSGTPFLGPSAVTIESRTTRSRRRSNHVDNIERVIEIDEGNSGDRNNGSNGASSSNSVDVAMARQMEADEMLARELQEQLYHEDLGVRFGEVNVHERPDLQHENVQNALPRRTRQASTARTVPTANASRPPRARPNTNITRAGYETRISFHNRMNRLRNRFPGRSRTASSSREGSSLFPPEMDVDLRMSILEALEAFDDMGVDNNLLDIHREFNENDYEMLLGLDDNNHRHSGTSANRINNLPQTTLENDNLEEACAICLETPTTGDTIRHLPCFHMFHKDCIDPWLRRKSSCPVCKHSVT